MRLRIITSICICILASGIISCRNSSANKKDTIDIADDKVANPSVTKDVAHFPISYDVTKKYPKKEYNLEELAEIIYIPLETTMDCLLGTIETLLILDDDIFISQYSTSSVYRFSMDGKFKNKIARQGRGPGEVVQIAGCAINSETKEVFIGDNRSRKIVVYNIDGTFLREFSINSYLSFNSMSIIDSDALLFINELQPYTDIEMEPGPLFTEISQKDGRIIKKLGPIVKEKTDHPYLINIKELSYFGDNLIAHTPQVADTAYSVSSSRVVTPKYIKIPPSRNFDKTELTATYLTFETDKLANFLTMKRVSKEKTEIGTITIEKESGEKYFGQFNLPMISYFNISSVLLRSTNIKNTIYCEISAPGVKRMIERGDIKDAKLATKLKDVKEDSNPVVLLLKF